MVTHAYSLIDVCTFNDKWNFLLFIERFCWNLTSSAQYRTWRIKLSEQTIPIRSIFMSFIGRKYHNPPYSSFLCKRLLRNFRCKSDRMSQDSLLKISSHAMIRNHESRCTRRTEAFAENGDSSNSNATVFTNRSRSYVSRLLVIRAFANRFTFKENGAFGWAASILDKVRWRNVRGWNDRKFQYPVPLYFLSTSRWHDGEEKQPSYRLWISMVSTNSCSKSWER